MARRPPQLQKIPPSSNTPSLINSPMLPNLKSDPDGGITLHIQNVSPGTDRESNWLPSPAGPFWISLRLYWPKIDALNDSWQQPQLEAVR